jgi:hypothetical protein
MNSDEDTCVQRNDKIPTGEIDGEIVALDLDRGDCFGLNEIGASIWAMAAEPISLGEIVNRLVDTHDVRRAQCLRDISAFIDEMIEAGLLRRVG